MEEGEGGVKDWCVMNFVRLWIPVARREPFDDETRRCTSLFLTSFSKRLCVCVLNGGEGVLLYPLPLLLTECGHLDKTLFEDEYNFIMDALKE